MKKLIILIFVSVLLVACQNKETSDNSSEKKEVKQTKTDTTKTKSVSNDKTENESIDKEKIKGFVESVYEANKVEDIEYLEEIANKDIQQVMYRQFMSADFSKQKRYTKSVSNVKVFVNSENEKNMLVSLEFKTKDTKDKKMSWQEKVVKINIQNNKISNYEEIGSRPIYETQN